MILLSSVQLSEGDAGSWGNWHSILDDYELERVAAFVNQKAKGMFIMSRIIARITLGQQLHVHPNEVPIVIGQYGRPKIKGNDTIDFNIAHSDGALTVAISTEGRIGVDIERKRPINVSDFKSYLTAQEVAFIESSTDTYAFFNAWSRLEAYSKMIGIGLDDSLTLRLLRQSTHGCQYELGDKMSYIQDLHIQPGYSSALASEKWANLTLSADASSSIYTTARHSDIDLSRVSIACWRSC